MSDVKENKNIQISHEERNSIDSDEEDDEVLPANEQQGPGGKILMFNRTSGIGISRNTVILDDHTPVYFVEVSQFAATFSRNKPDLTLRSGNEHGPTVAISFWSWPRTFKCGIGGSPEDSATQWTEMKRSGFFGGRVFTFEWKGATYRLARAKSEDTKGTNAKGIGHILGKHFKVVDERSGDLLALYTAALGGKESGTMSFKPGIPEDLEILFVLGVASWREVMRRNRHHGYAASGG